MYLMTEPEGSFVRFLGAEEIAAVSRVCQKRAPSSTQRQMLDRLFREMRADSLVLNCPCRAAGAPTFVVQSRMGIMCLAAHPQSRAHLPCCPVVHRQAGGRRVSQ